MTHGDELSPALLQPDGSFVFQGVMDGTYNVYLAPLPSGLSVGEVRHNGSRQPRALITPNRAAADQKLELVVYPATASAQVSVTSGSHPAKDAQVALFPEEYDIEDPQSGVRTTRTDANGRTTFSNLIAGKYRLLAFSPEAAWRTSPSLRNLVATAARVIDLAAGASVSADLKQTDIE
ncbi:hypothetical protein [uncultured Paludibaculum sp.]|uniref:hypothetical protein n=1 Tax=uncultured Paludibaculum sp. TaxID=1765020 RepID=UPI002AABBFB4|nr:hypothetical protein [uncultured Paludibaculum sp.]